MHFIPLAILTVMIASTAAANDRVVLGKLVQSGYAEKNGSVVTPEGSDQVWAHWIFRSCEQGKANKTYEVFELVHSVKFPKRGGLYFLSISPDDEIKAFHPADKVGAARRC